MSAHRMKMNHLEKMLAQVGAMTLERLQLALNAVKRSDERLATKAREKDLEIDHLGLDIEDNVLALLGEKHLVADEMWFALSALKIKTSCKWVVKSARKIESLARGGEINLRRAPIREFVGCWAEAEKAIRMAVESLKNRNVAIAEEILFLGATPEKTLDLDMAMIALLLADPETIGQALSFFGVSRLLETVRDSASEVAKEILFLSGELSQAERWRRPEMAM